MDRKQRWKANGGGEEREVGTTMRLCCGTLQVLMGAKLEREITVTLMPLKVAL